MSTLTLRGIYPATLTPYIPSGQVNGPTLKRLVEAHLHAGVNGFYVGGATGEGILQTVDERLAAAKFVMEQVGGRCQVVVHVGAVAADDAVKLARAVAALGVDAIAALPPIFYKVPFDAVVDFYRQVASAAGLPLLVYYIPGLNGLTFSDEQFDELLAIDHVVGIKFSDYNLFVMQQLLERHRQAVVMSGNDEVLLPALSIGAHGSIGLTLNIMPGLYVALYRAVTAGDFRTAQELQHKANRLIAIILRFGAGGGSAVKPIMNMIGFDCGAPRLPLPALDGPQTDRLREQLTRIGFFNDPIYTGWAKDHG